MSVNFVNGLGNYIKLMPKGVLKPKMPGEILRVSEVKNAVSNAVRGAEKVKMYSEGLSSLELVGKRGDIVIGKFPTRYPAHNSCSKAKYNQTLFFRQEKDGFLKLLKSRTVSPLSNDKAFIGFPGYCYNPDFIRVTRRCDVFPNGTIKSTVRGYGPDDHYKYRDFKGVETVIKDNNGYKVVEKRLVPDETNPSELVLKTFVA